jgi:hypothetical protein
MAAIPVYDGIIAHCFPARAGNLCGALHLATTMRVGRHGRAHVQHMQKALTQMNLQIHHVISDITG